MRRSSGGSIVGGKNKQVCLRNRGEQRQSAGVNRVVDTFIFGKGLMATIPFSTLFGTKKNEKLVLALHIETSSYALAFFITKWLGNE
ncbi:MAG: hypothetical protein N2560_06000 [Ignavibacteria bacterium]|nr:hypothetical protein [Ignavibacteria bacterium]